MNFKGKRFEKKKMTDVSTPLERSLIGYITKTGREQIKKRRKAGLSVYFLKDGRIVERRPDRTEIPGTKIGSSWVTLDKEKRTVVLK